MDYLNIIIPSIVGIISALVTSFFAARWAYQQAYREKWWERKEQAYREIIEALHDLLRYAQLEYDCYKNYKKYEHPKSKEFGDKYIDAYWRVQRMTDIGSFVISEEAAEILCNLRKRNNPDYETDLPDEIRAGEIKLYKEALDGIRQCAKKDLKV